MASRGRFQIPSLSEMEAADTGTVKEIEPVFKKHKEAHHDQPVTKDMTVSVNKTMPTKTASIKTLSAHDTRDKDEANDRLCSSSDQEYQVSNTVLTEDASQSAGTDNLKGSSASIKVGSSNCLIVNPRQRGNPILKSVRNVPWEYGNIVPDYIMGQSNCALFLSLRYHQLHPNYIHDRLKQLGHSYDLRVILVQVDVKEPHQILKELAKICILADCTLILAFSPEEAGRYLETYKVFENKPPEAIMEKTEANFMAKFTDCLTRVKSVNKTDCSTLLTAFGSLADVINAKQEDLSLCPGFGPQKAWRVHSLFHEPFLRNSSTGKRKAAELSPDKQASSSAS